MNADDRSRYPGAVTAQPWPAIRLDDTSDPWAPVRRHCRPVTLGAALLVLLGATFGPAQPARSATTPTVTTQASGGGPVGVRINDQVTLSGGSSPTGTITVTAYGPNDTGCSKVANTATIDVTNGNATYTSTAFAPTAPGTYQFVAVYNGDTNNSATTPGSCSDPTESVTITHPQNGIPGSAFCDPGAFSEGTGNQGWGNLGHGNQGDCNVGNGNEGDQNDGDGSVVDHPWDD